MEKKPIVKDNAIKVPNSGTLKAIEELESGQGKRFNNIKALLEDLDEDDDFNIQKPL